MKIYHITSAQNVESLLRHPVFYAPATTYPSTHRGLNAFSFKKGYFLDQVPENAGVKLVLEWSGLVKRVSMHTRLPLCSNVLYIQYPWRCFIPVDSDPRQLRVLGVLPDRSGVLDQHLGIGNPGRWGKHSDYTQFTQQKKSEYLKRIWQRCAEEPVYLSVQTASEQDTRNRIPLRA